jgi:hypothetical protein
MQAGRLKDCQGDTTEARKAKWQTVAACALQGSLEIKDTHYPLGRSHAPRHRPIVGSWGGGCPYFRETPVWEQAAIVQYTLKSTRACRDPILHAVKITEALRFELVLEKGHASLRITSSPPIQSIAAEPAKGFVLRRVPL